MTVLWLLQHKRKAQFSTDKIRLFGTKVYNIIATSEYKSSVVQIKTINSHYEFKTDLPKTMGGKDTAPQPVELLLGSLAGCTHATARFVGRNMTPRLNIMNIQIKLHGSRDDRGALDELPITAHSPLPRFEAKLTNVSGIVKVDAVDQHGNKIHLSESTLSLLAHHTENRCPVASMINASGCRMDLHWMNL